MITLLLAVGLLAHPACVGDGHNQHRSKTAVRHFRATHPCPSGPDKGSTTRCRGHVVDHICPLSCCGKDDPGNMEYQTFREGHAKDLWEQNCSTCRAWSD